MTEWFKNEWGFVPSEEDLARWFEKEPGAGILLSVIASTNWERKVTNMENVIDAWPKGKVYNPSQRKRNADMTRANKKEEQCPLEK